MSTLTGKQQSFVAHYLVTFHAAQSAKLAGYRANSKHSFESIGSENLKKPAIAKAVEEHFRMCRMSGEEVLVELTKLARGSDRDKVKALALLSQHYGLLDGKPFIDQAEVDRQVEAEITKLDEHYAKQAVEINAKIDETCRRLDDTNNAFNEIIANVREEYKDDPPGLAALNRLKEYFEAIAAGKEPPITTEMVPKPTKVEIIPPQKRLQAAPIERMIAEVVETESLEEELPPQPPRCRHGYPPKQCPVIEVGYDCPHYYNRDESRYHYA